MNRCIFHGRLTADPKISFGSDNLSTTYVRFTLAVEDRSWKLEDGKYHVDFIPCKAIGRVAEIISTNLYKGKEILLYGKMQSGSYEKEGKTIYTLDFLVQEMEFCGKKTESSAPYEDAFINIPDDMDEELPFQ